MISVCMATYNGGRYIEEQLNSILSQLGPDDEVIICDDCSTDNTVEKATAIGDSRIKIFRNEKNLGYIRNFEKSVVLANGDYIFLSDQDDIWPSGRIALMLSAMKSASKSVVVGNIECFERTISDRMPLSRQIERGHNRPSYRNIIRMLLGGLPCFGCAMGFDAKFRSNYV